MEEKLLPNSKVSGQKEKKNLRKSRKTRGGPSLERPPRTLKRIRPRKGSECGKDRAVATNNPQIPPLKPIWGTERHEALRACNGARDTKVGEGTRRKRRDPKGRWSTLFKACITPKTRKKKKIRNPKDHQNSSSLHNTEKKSHRKSADVEKQSPLSPPGGGPWPADAAVKRGRNP